MLRKLRSAAMVAALPALAFVSLGLSAPVASASVQTPGTLYVDCVIVSGHTYKAVFGYDSKAQSAYTVPVGPNNDVTPSQLNGEQVTTFEPGNNPAAWRSTSVSTHTQIVWSETVNGWTYTATATASDTACPAGTPLTASGNAMAGPIVLAASLPVAAGLFVVEERSRRRAARARAAA